VIDAKPGLKGSRIHLELRLRGGAGNQVFVTYEGQSKTFQFDSSSPIQSLKAQIAEWLKVPIAQLELRCNGRLVNDCMILRTELVTVADIIPSKELQLPSTRAHSYPTPSTISPWHWGWWKYCSAY